MEVLRGQIGRMQQFLQHLLAFSRPARVHTQPLAINEVILETLPLLAMSSAGADRFEKKAGGAFAAAFRRSRLDPAGSVQSDPECRDAMSGRTITLASRLNPRDPPRCSLTSPITATALSPARWISSSRPFIPRKRTAADRSRTRHLRPDHEPPRRANPGQKPPAQGSTFTLCFKCGKVEKRPCPKLTKWKIARPSACRDPFADPDPGP